MGNALEWYDFTVYGYGARVIGKLFFPSDDPVASLLAAYGVFAVAFLIRPLGSVVFGHVADRYGRKPTLTISVAMMALSTVAIGLLPTHAAIGAAAAALLIALRLIQGLSVGGEFTTSITFLAEESPLQRRGFYCSWPSCTAGVGQLMGSTMFLLVETLLPPAEVAAWGWRIPFLFGIVLDGAALWLRHARIIMQRLWSADELGERWSLLPKDLALLAGRVDAGKFGFAVQLAFWRQHGRFPDEETDVAPAVVAHLAAQIGVGADALDGYAWAGRSGRRHRVAIIDHLAVAAFDEAAETRFRRWLADDALPREFAAPALDEELSAWFARSRVTRPGAYHLGRILRSAQATHDDAALQRVAERLDAGMRERLGALLADDGDGTAYARLAASPGRVGLESLLAEIAKLERRRALALPSDLMRAACTRTRPSGSAGAAVESAWELRRHLERIRLPLLAFWCAPREAEVVDGLVELLIQVTHRVTVKAERRVVDELVEEAREVCGKAGILFRVVKAASDSPEGVVREVIFPAIGEQTFDALVREARAFGTPQSRRVHTAVHASYGSHYRRMMPKLLTALDFRSNNGTHRPLLDALDAIRRAKGEGRQFFKADEVAIDGVICPK